MVILTLFNMIFYYFTDNYVTWLILGLLDALIVCTAKVADTYSPMAALRALSTAASNSATHKFDFGQETGFGHPNRLFGFGFVFSSVGVLKPLSSGRIFASKFGFKFGV